MTPFLSTATMSVSSAVEPLEVTSSVQLARPVERGTANEAMGRLIADPIAPLALERAQFIFPSLRHELSPLEWRSSVTRLGEAVMTFFSGRKYAILTADNDGELILTLTDRGSDNEADAEVVGSDVAVLVEKIRSFLQH
jgi:hypothetical protein